MVDLDDDPRIFTRDRGAQVVAGRARRREHEHLAPPVPPRGGDDLGRVAPTPPCTTRALAAAPRKVQADGNWLARGGAGVKDARGAQRQHAREARAHEFVARCREAQHGEVRERGAELAEAEVVWAEGVALYA